MEDSLKILITGGAGFIGSNFADSAVISGHTVCVLDNLETGKKAFIDPLILSNRISFALGDIRNAEFVAETFLDFKPDLVVHFAANADVRRGLEHPRKDLEQNTVGTWNVAEAARIAGCKRILFSSTGSVYGEPTVFPTPEDCPFPVQTSLYGASKLAAESILSAYSQGFGINVLVFRFVSILGQRYTHGHVYDFTRSLQRNPRSLKVLGDGLQKKSYLHIDDLTKALWLGINECKDRFSIFNVGHKDSITVNESIRFICEYLNVNPVLEYSGGSRGWIGDNPRIELDCRRLNKLGWNAEIDLKSSVQNTVQYLVENPEV